MDDSKRNNNNEAEETKTKWSSNTRDNREKNEHEIERNDEDFAMVGSYPHRNETENYEEIEQFVDMLI